MLLYLADVFSEYRAARRQRRSGAEHVNRGGAYPWMRAAITVAMRDLNVALLMGDVVEGIPVVYSTFVGYDEVAHHSGITEPDAFAVLRRHDAELARLERAVRLAPRPYRLVVLSDHGQTQGRPFRQRYGLTLEELVEGAMGGVDVFAPASPDEGFATLGGALTEARAEESVAGRIVARATRNRLVDGEVALASNREAMEQMSAEKGAASPAVVLASGGLGLITLSASRERMSVGEIGELYPGLIETVSAHPGIGFVMVRSERATRSSSAARGRATSRTTASPARTLCAISARTPPITCGAPTASRTARTSSSTAPSTPSATRWLPSRSSWDPTEALGGWQMHPFALVPAQWSTEPTPIVGVEAMHVQLRRWLDETGLDLRPHRARG